ncbi:MAG TPA: hypothetical protein VNJ53_12110 [Gaiellaceae bacterium]|nr:hypothetical protein [Gaiellaceae bacterium]
MTSEARAARERKQKIVLVVGSLVLAGLLAFQLPRVLGGSASAGEASGETTAGAEQDGTVPAAAATAPTPVPVAAEPAPAGARLFSSFPRKDPFVQQIEPPASAPAKGEGGPATAGKGETREPRTLGFTPDGEPAASVTVISVNGTRQALLPGQAFPASDPVFVLVAERPRAKTAVVGIAGGAYASGRKTTTLRVGKPLVLVNTTTGARYRLVLVAVGNGAAARGKSEKTTTTPPASPSP